MLKDTFLVKFLLRSDEYFYVILLTA